MNPFLIYRRHATIVVESGNFDSSIMIFDLGIIDHCIKNLQISYCVIFRLQIHKWREGRTDEGERPRTYDKFYQVALRVKYLSLVGVFVCVFFSRKKPFLMEFEVSNLFDEECQQIFYLNLFSENSRQLSRTRNG